MKKQSRGAAPRQIAGQISSLSIENLMGYLTSVHKPRKLDDLLRELHLPRSTKKSVQDMLWKLESGGDIIRLAGGAYVPADDLKRLTGVLDIQSGGTAFVLSDSDRKGDVFIAPGNTAGAWRGDRVLVGLFPLRSGRNREGKILKVLEQGPREFAARVLRSLADGTLLCEPLDSRISATFLTDASSLGVPGKEHGKTPVRKGDILRLRAGECESPGLWKASALTVMGDEDSFAVQEDIVKAGHGIATSFTESALAEASSFGAVPDKASLEMAGRKDLATLPFVTIDGEDAKDFDDAIHVAREKDGFRLHVAIADVAHYVRPGSPLDAEAHARGNSCYFPLSVEPMLPEALSNGLCSLKPEEPRLVMVAEIFFDGEGKPGATAFYPARMVSRARLTYTLVRDGLLEDDAEAGEKLAESLPMLRDALTLARLLAAARGERGSLDFELPEPHYVFDGQGELVGIEPAKGSFANRLIEEFMVAANEAVARYLTKKDIPMLYRVHPEPDPDKLKNLFGVLSSTGIGREFGIRLPARPSPRDLQGLLRAVKGSGQEYVIGRLTLRSMMQASYSPDLEPHFGLASECYCHFTSPIRRYADLVVHRALKTALGSEDAAPLPDRKKLARVAEHLRDCERAALEAEREIARRLGAIFMRDKVGENFDGVISGLADFGIFVELSSVMVEGMIRLSSLGDDYYTYNAERQELRGQRHGRVYRLGQAVRVRVFDVNPARQEITLVFDQGDQAVAASGEHRGDFRAARRTLLVSARPRKKNGNARSQKDASGRGRKNNGRSSRRKG